MNNHIVYGPVIAVNEEQFGWQMFNKLNSFDDSKILMINSELNEELSVKDIRINSIKLALALRKHVNKGDVIAAIAENDGLFILPLLASLYLGTTIAFINPVYKPRELAHSLSNVKPKIIFCSSNALNNLMWIKKDIADVKEIILMDRGTLNGLRTLEEFMKGSERDEDVMSFKPVEVKKNDTAIILSSSGTTGMPKGVNITYRNLASQILYFGHKDYLGIQPEDTTLILLPIFHVLGLLLMLIGVLLNSTAVIIKRFKPELFLSSVEKYRVTKLPLVPPLALFLAKNPIVDKYDMSNIKDIVCGAAPIAQSLIDQVYERLKIEIRQIYGLTETGGVTCVPPGLSKRNTAGRVGPNLQIAIKDTNTREILPLNQNGEICIKGPNVANGYFSNKEATNIAFDSDGYFLTGDVGYFDEEGHLFIVDRIKELIKYKGFQVAPAELEDILLKHEAVKDVAVVGVPEESAGELPTAFVVRQPGVDVTEDALQQFVSGQVSTYKRLSGGVKFIDEIPKNPSGKILRRELKERAMINNFNK